jgi:D-alanine-D-alanine ligase
MRVLVLVDPEVYFGSPHQFSRMGDPATASMECHIVFGLRRLRHNVKVLAFNPDTQRAVSEIQRSKPDVVFNLVEHIGRDRRRAADVPAMLELLGIPFTGCAAVGMSVSLDKALSKQVLADQNLRVPKFSIVPLGFTPRVPDVRLPVIVKPRYGGGSEGISLGSIIEKPHRLAARAALVHRSLKQDAICEEYIAGREISIGVLGDSKPLLVLPPRETVFGKAAMGGPAIASDRVKSSRSYRERWGISYQKAELSEKVEKAVKELARKAYEHLELRGYVRIDMRLDSQERPVFLEANSNPDLRPVVFGVMASWVGISYEELLGGIIELALRS